MFEGNMSREMMLPVVSPVYVLNRRCAAAFSVRRKVVNPFDLCCSKILSLVLASTNLPSLHLHFRAEPII